MFPSSPQKTLPWRKRSQVQVSEKRTSTWSRSDTISALSFAIAVLAVVVAIKAETRVHQSEKREAAAVAVAVGSKVRSISNGASHAAAFMQGFLDHRSSTKPRNRQQIDAYIVELASNIEFPELIVSPEQITVA